jgi:hypothetical protein
MSNFDKEWEDQGDLIDRYLESPKKFDRLMREARSTIESLKRGHRVRVCNKADQLLDLLEALYSDRCGESRPMSPVNFSRQWWE